MKCFIEFRDDYATEEIVSDLCISSEARIFLFLLFYSGFLRFQFFLKHEK